MINNTLRLVLLVLLLFLPATIYSQSSADVKTSGQFKPDKVTKGRVTQAIILLEIPPGLHVQSNKPLDKFLIATKLDVEAPSSLKIGTINYPRPVIRQLKFSKTPVAVYEGKVLLRFNVTIPSNYSGGSTEIKGHLRFQACNDDSCFPPITREVKMWLNVE